MFARRFGLALLVMVFALTGCAPPAPTASPSEVAPINIEVEVTPLSIEDATKLMTEAQPELAFPPLISVFVEGEWAVGLTNSELTVLFRLALDGSWAYIGASNNWRKEEPGWCDSLTGRIELRLGC